MGKIRFATVGTSKITERFLSAGRLCEEFEMTASYSRNLERAEAFAREHGADKWYDSLEVLGSDSEIDAVYVASPNYMHHDQVCRLLKAGKHVICEKSIASNYREAEEMFRTAKENQVILLEAARNIFDPGMTVAKENLCKLGTIRRASINYCQYSSRYDSFKEGQEHNIFKRECSAGALMDIGVYCVHTLVYLLGEPDRIMGQSVMIRGDIDGAGSILAGYSDKVAEIKYSKITDSVLPTEIEGENGNMLIYGSNRPEKVKVLYRDGREELLFDENEEMDMQHEIRRFVGMIQGREDVSPHVERSLTSMKIMDEVRRQCGISFPADERA